MISIISSNSSLSNPDDWNRIIPSGPTTTVRGMYIFRLTFLVEELEC